MSLSMSLDPKTVGELTEFLLSLIDFTKERNRKKLLQFLCGLTNSNNKENLKLAVKLSHQIRTGNQCIDDPQQLHMFFLYIKPWTRHFANDEKSLLYQIWRVNSNSTDQSRAGHIIVQIFEEFLNDQKVITVFNSCLFAKTLQQLESECSEDRRKGRFLLTNLIEGSINDSRNDEDFNDLHFLSYITIIQCLEIERINNRFFNEDNHGLIWMRTLYIRLLEEDNSLVLRWTLEYLMDHVTIAELEHANLLMEFLTATNRMELHDLDNYALPERKMEKFISGMERNQFLMVFVQIPWCDVPLIRWLRSMDSDKTQITHILLHQLSTLINRIENDTLREYASERILDVFVYTIDKMSLIEYIELFDKLFRTNYVVQFAAMSKLCEKISDCENIDDQIVHLKPHTFDLLFHWQLSVYFPEIFTNALTKRKVPKSRLGLWRLSILFDLKDYTKVLNFLHTEYDINTKLFKECTNLKELQEHLLDKLNCNTEEEKQFVLKQSVNLFVRTNIRNWTQLEELNLNPVEMLKNATLSTFIHMMNILPNHKRKLQNEKVIDTILEAWKQNFCFGSIHTTGNILSYAANNLNIDEREKLVEQMILKSNNDCEVIARVLSNTNSVPKTLLIQELLYEENTTDPNCIEYALLSFLRCSNIKRRNEFINYLHGISNNDSIEIFEQLLRINETITKNVSIVENSKEHRIQMRIVRSLIKIKLWSNDLWQALLAPSNQLNISYLYEYLLAHQLIYSQSAFDLLMDKLQSLSSLESNQQDSIISVVYIYYMTYPKKLKLENFHEVIKLLSEQIVHSSAETQLFIQLVLHNLAVKCEQLSLELPKNTCMKIAPNFSFEDKASQYLIEARLMMPDFKFFNVSADVVLYMTNAPIDEIDLKYLFQPGNFSLLKKMRNAFKFKNDENDTKTELKAVVETQKTTRKPSRI